MSFNHFINALRDLFKDQKDCDVTFSCKDPASTTGESTIMAHKFVLSLASDVFHTMFHGYFAKHFENEGNFSDPIYIEDIQMPTFKLLLSVIYTMSVDFETLEIAAEFYYAAHKYNVIDALEFIKTYMMKEAKPENAITFYETACLYENQELKDTCLKIFSDKTVDILKSPAFVEADPKTIEAIYKLNVLNTSSEAELIDALERYIGHNQQNDSNIAEKMRPSVSHIRFLTLDALRIGQTTLLNAEDAVSVIRCLPFDSVSKMPTFLSSSREKRDSPLDLEKREMLRKCMELARAARS